jgi:hypothetical protein
VVLWVFKFCIFLHTGERPVLDCSGRTPHSSLWNNGGPRRHSLQSTELGNNHFHIYLDSLFINYPTIWHYTTWASDIIIKNIQKYHKLNIKVKSVIVSTCICCTVLCGRANRTRRFPCMRRDTSITPIWMQCWWYVIRRWWPAAVTISLRRHRAHCLARRIGTRLTTLNYITQCFTSIIRGLFYVEKWVHTNPHKINPHTTWY